MLFHLFFFAWYSFFFLSIFIYFPNVCIYILKTISQGFPIHRSPTYKPLLCVNCVNTRNKNDCAIYEYVAIRRLQI